MRLKHLLGNLQLTDWIALGLLLVYVIAFSWMTILQHESFRTNALDLAKFDQAIWNTAQGRPFQITLIQQSIVQSHFSPILAIYAPLYWIWSDIRLLFIVQSICLAGAGFLVYWFFRADAPWLGLTVFLAYLMHPSLHQVNLYEFRRITTAVPGVSLALYCLLRRRYGGMALGLVVALLSKENTAFLVMGVGLYLILVHRTVKIGLPVLLIGTAWLILVPLVVLPALGTPQFLSRNTGYSLAGKYFSYLGHSPAEMLQTLVRNPGAPLAYALRPKRLEAIVDLFWPTGFLFLLSPGIAAFSLPFLAYLLASKSDTMGQLAAWYPAVVLPLLSWAAAMGIAHLREHWRAAALVVLLVAAGAGFATLSEIRPGRWPDMERFRVTDHHRQVAVALKEIPRDAVVAAQDPLVPHLSQREQIYLFPWIPEETRPDYIVLDREMRTYPVGRPTYRTLFYDVLSGTEHEIDQQVDSLYIFRHAGKVSPCVERTERWKRSLTLMGYCVAVAPPGVAFGPVPDALPAGSTVRLSLFWRVDESIEQNHTVFVHALSPDGQLLAQHDSWPADAHRPTSVLPIGTVFRDVHYLTISRSADRDVRLHVGLYDGEGERLFTQQGEEVVQLALRD
jgi:uncharacterized membrane protein